MTTAERTKLKKELRQALSEALRQLRERLPHKPTQEILAGTVGMDRSYWGDLERGERSLTLFNLWRMATALGVSPSRLVLAVDRNYRRISGLSNTAPRGSPTEEAIKHLRAFMDESPEMKWLSDTRQRSIYCNRPLRDFVGVEHVEGSDWQGMFHPDDLAKYLAKSKVAYARREPYLSRYRMRCGEGKYRLLVQHAVPQFTPKGIFIGFLGTIIEEPDNCCPTSAIRLEPR